MCIKNHLKSYSEATSRPERSAIITNIVSSIREAAEAGFVRMDATTGHWYEVGDKMARDKVRDAISVPFRHGFQFGTQSSWTQTNCVCCNPTLSINCAHLLAIRLGKLFVMP